jgi:hypothetical protein
MRDKINLFNHWHYGDIFFSRIMINSLIEYYDINYYHNLKSPLLIDIDNLTEFNGIPSNFNLHNSDLLNKNINTWIGQDNMKYLTKKNVGCSFENYMCLVEDILKFLGLQIKNHEDYLPTINYKKISNIDNISEKIESIKKEFKKVILVSNGRVNSGQSVNFNFDPIIERLSHEFNDSVFILTEKTNVSGNNIKYTSDITNYSPDLLHISYISTKSDIIIGRSSGPYSYSLVKENVLDPNKTFISFNHKIAEARYYETIKSKLVWSNDYSENNILNKIRNELSI